MRVRAAPRPARSTLHETPSSVASPCVTGDGHLSYGPSDAGDVVDALEVAGRAQVLRIELDDGVSVRGSS
jgi:hypothetical protein